MSLCDEPSTRMAPEGSGASGDLRSQRHLASKVLQDDEPILPVNDDTPRDEGSSGTTTPSGILEIWRSPGPNSPSFAADESMVDSDSEIH